MNMLKNWHVNCARKMILAILLDIKIRIPSCVYTVARFFASNVFRIKSIKISTEKVINAKIAVEVKYLMNGLVMTNKPKKRKYGNSSSAYSKTSSKSLKDSNFDAK